MSDRITPESEEALGEAVKSAVATRKSLEIKGGGTKQGFGHPVKADRLISTSAISGISIYEPEALTLVVKAGTPLLEVKKVLDAENQHLPFEPADYRKLLATQGEATIGGVVACGVSGPRRIQAGAVRDSLIGVRFVDGSGTVLKNGGRVMKNVTGYDLVKLLCGSHGTLGVLTELSFKLLPAPETSASILLHGLDDKPAIAALSAALTSPYDISGAAHLPAHDDGTPVTAIRIEGFETSVEYRARQLSQLLKEFGSPEIAEASASEPLWLRIRDVEDLANKEGAVWRISVKPADGPEIVAGLEQSGEARAVYDWGGGLVWLLVPQGDDCRAAEIRTAVAKFGGHATLLRADEASRRKIAVFHPQDPAVATISANLRNRFDPAGILNPGRMEVSEERAAA